MMREIIFRGKRKDNNEWVTGCLIIENPPLQCFPSDQTEQNKYLIGASGFADWNMPRPFTAAEVYPESIGQYTGVKDKNGKQIFEGDIVEDEGGGKMPVTWIQSHCQFMIEHPDLTDELTDDVAPSLEVVDTLYEMILNS